ncbi:hypothetical protein ABIA30_000435 [Mycobacterium sp. MAA66]|uniref:DUF4334 domain-containing protein n=1 Tax=Mycobacterium sp. MAA66 TaxID=3156297 RepID=UPI0035142790
MLLQELLATAPTRTDDALDLFDAAPAVEPEFMIGTWHGAEMPTGHPMDGLLETSGWWGKQFVDAETVHPLLFPDSSGRTLWPMNPALAFGGLGLANKLPLLHRVPLAKPIALMRPLLQAGSAKARLRTTRYRGTDTATMVYDQLPINDVFRKLTDDAVVGAMDFRGSRRPYFFVLRRENSLGLPQ